MKGIQVAEEQLNSYVQSIVRSQTASLVLARQLESTTESLMGVLDKETISILTGISGILKDISSNLEKVYLQISDSID